MSASLPRRAVRALWFTSIRRQLVLGIALVHAVLMTVFVLDLTLREREALRAQSLEHTRDAALALARSSGSWVLAADVVGLEEVLAFDSERLRYAMVLSPEGKVLGHTDRQVVGSYVRDATSRELLYAGEAPQVLVDSASLIDVAAPIVVNDQLIGWARVAMGQEHNAAAQALITRNGVVYTLLAILIGSAFALLMARSLTVDLHRMVDLTQRFQRGEWTARAPLERSDELGQLSGALHQLLDALVEQRTLTDTAQADTQAEKERLLVTLQSIADGVITTDVEGRVTLLNQVAAHLTGWSPADAVGRPVSEVYLTRAPDRADRVAPPGPLDLELLPLGTSQPVRVTSRWADICGPAGEVIGRVVVFHDASEERRAQAQEARMKRLESVGVLAGGIAHDFNNILTGIMGNLGLALIYADEGSGELMNVLQAAETASVRAKDLTQRLLTFSKGGNPVLKSAHLPELLKEITDFTLSGGKIRCHYHLAQDLWPVYADLGQISQVVQNLVINAVQAMPQGGTLTVEAENTQVDEDLAPLAPGRYVRVGIRDTGVGISQRCMEHIFDPYFTTKSGGSGLGLAVTQTVILKHGGDITVASREGEGTTFTFFLPAAAEAPAAPKGARLRTAKRAVTVLILDDEAPIRSLVRRALSREGHRVLSAADGDEALRLVAEALGQDQRVDVALMDLTLPGGVGGREVAPRLRALDPSVRMVVSSGYSNDPVMAAPTAHGFCAVLPKPYTRSELVALVEDLISRPPEPPAAPPDH
ncbi:MAG: response regulator [Deltaproteobacteria bacterium]|nr:response regulator [Deltaproteobacteria bacterium]